MDDGRWVMGDGKRGGFNEKLISLHLIPARQEIENEKMGRNET